MSRPTRISMGYDHLNREDFDAIVTGELTHYALWLEDEVNGLIVDYFLGSSGRRDDFTRLFLHRDGLTFQDKLEIARGMLPLFGEPAEQVGLKELLNRVEEFKGWRNAMAHGRDVSRDGSSILHIEITSRSGKPKTVDISPASHEKTIQEVDQLLRALQSARAKLVKAP